MANFVFNQAKLRMQTGALDWDSDTIKEALITGSGTPSADDDTVAAVLATASEANGTGYASGPGGSGRKTLSCSAAVDDANDRSDVTIASRTYTSISLAATVKGRLIYEHISGSDDALNIPLLWIDTVSGLPFTTNGSDLTVGADTFRIS